MFGTHQFELINQLIKLKANYKTPNDNSLPNFMFGWISENSKPMCLFIEQMVNIKGQEVHRETAG